ncbi:hypothetical protein [Sulfitobacter donghicola]|uniref:Uncharacterized protein n=1 Tax=Sulfitobacter donghicola DSW-25 = KCTC 12864 = JCM 14565 TaxID=1300350 RepID=A0A073IGH4_9RHOB|nr:hypothetical protein [Sulfitobacter donghicola]KEJ88645.1 hypothetical protein DSW25_13345 [Sulfitobacter donghicola DSW-25 = KCTC 12864 = JCM 14565]
MKAIIAGAVAIVVIAIGSNFILGGMGFSSKEVYAGDNVRLD